MLVQGGQVHGDEDVRTAHDGRAYLSVADEYGAIGGAAAHLGAVGGQPGDVAALQQARVGQELAGKQDALPAKARDQYLRGAHFAASSLNLSLYTPRG